MKRVQVKKGSFLQRTGDLNTKIYYVHSGLLRSYLIDEKGKEHIFMFAPAGWTIADANPPNIPGTLFIDALEDSEVSILSKDINRENNNVQSLVNRIGVLQKRVLMLMSSSALDRYDHFLETYQEIAQRVPQRMIASYLGVTPEALSKLKGERKKEKGKP